ncbi:MAG: HAD-IA family hydrolase [Gammaproteobacteria bacterium]|nr:HAD-IA family hydrolase [Gammaproteobacteria bacterium]MDH5802416.1 HAD-IA family hydrolase [Gammaproteobacteria bacterium]
MAVGYELLIFDWDGTLIDSEKNIIRCMQLALEDIGAQTREPDAISHIIGLGLAEAIEALCPELKPAQRSQLVERYRYHFLSSEPSEPFAGVAVTLNALVDRGYYLAVATGKGRVGLDKALAETGFKPHFHVTRCADETRSKPHPQMVLEIMDFVGVDAHQALMIGDTVYDLDMATNAGMDSAAVLYGVHAAEKLQACNPIVCLQSMTELLPWLEQRA